MSSGNLVAVTFVKETVYDTTPTDSPDWETLRFTKEDFNAQPTVATSEEIRSDRMIGDQFKTMTETNGGCEFEFSADSFDTLLDGAMNAAPAGGIWKVGAEDISYTVTKEFTDLTANQFFHFSGERVQEMNLSFIHGEALKGSFIFAGASVATSSTDLVGTGSVAVATTTRIMNAVSDLSGIEIDGTSFTGCIQEITLKLVNNLSPANCIGKDTASDQQLGTAEVSGTIKAYLTNTTIQWYTDKVQNQTQFDIRWLTTDGTAIYEWDMPNCKINSPAPKSDGLNTQVMIEAEFNALYDGTALSNLVITKT